MTKAELWNLYKKTENNLWAQYSDQWFNTQGSFSVRDEIEEAVPDPVLIDLLLSDIEVLQNAVQILQEAWPS